MSQKALNHPYRVGRRKQPPKPRRDAVSLKAIRKLEVYLTQRKSLEAARVGKEAVEYLGPDEDEPL